MEIKKIGVVGSGMMGAGIAQVCAQSGYQVVLNDINSGALEKAAIREKTDDIPVQLEKLNDEVSEFLSEQTTAN